MATAEAFLTAEEFLQLPDEGPAELVRGRIVRMNPPGTRHGAICSKVVRILGVFIDEHDLGHVVCNDSGVVTERGPDTVRGADVAYYSYARLPKGRVPDGYPAVAPDLIIEVRSPSDRWGQILAKVAEYLEAGTTVVCVLDPRSESAHVYRADLPLEIVTADQELAFPDVLEGFRVAVRRFFE